MCVCLSLISNRVSVCLFLFSVSPTECLSLIWFRVSVCLLVCLSHHLLLCPQFLPFTFLYVCLFRHLYLFNALTSHTSRSTLTLSPPFSFQHQTGEYWGLRHPLLLVHLSIFIIYFFHIVFFYLDAANRAQVIVNEQQRKVHVVTLGSKWRVDGKLTFDLFNLLLRKLPQNKPLTNVKLNKAHPSRCLGEELCSSRVWKPN